MDRSAYPQIPILAPKAPFNLEKWREMALKIRTASRQYDKYSRKQLLNYFTSDWDYQERDCFKRWLEYQSTQQNQYKRGQRMMQKTAYDFQSANKEEQLKDLKKKLRSRVNSAEKLLTKMLDEGLLVGGEDKALYIGRILQKLKEEINMLRRPELMKARSKRAIHIIRKAGLEEVAEKLASGNLLDDVTGENIIKTAEADVSSVLADIKAELDTFNYGVHLNKLMDIRYQLEQLGRHSEAGMILDIIKKELSGIDGVHKKLVDVYTSLGQIPRQHREPKQVEKPVTPRVKRPQLQPRRFI